MTNEEKAKSLWYHFCTEKSCGGYDDCKLCPKAQVHPQLLEMAVWKEQQMIEKAVEWLEPLFKDLAGYYCGGDLVEDFKKFMSEQC